MEFEPFCCPICQDVLYKPVVNPCGHWACNLCLHQSMNPWAASTCFLCRREYTHWGAECGQLSTIISKAFPDDYKRRALEEDTPLDSGGDTRTASCSTRGENEDAVEVEVEVLSPGRSSAQVLPPLSSSSCSAETPHVQPQEFQEQDFMCRCCRDLLVEPLVFNCGCLCCQCCAPLPAVPSAVRSAASSAAATSSSSSAASDSVSRCPVCRARCVAPLPEVCRPLRDLLASAFPARTQARRLAIQAGKRSKKEVKSSPSPTLEQEQEQEEEEVDLLGRQDPDDLDSASCQIEVNEEGSKEEDKKEKEAEEEIPMSMSGESEDTGVGGVISGGEECPDGDETVPTSDAQGTAEGGMGVTAGEEGAEEECEESAEGLLHQLEFIHHGVGCDMCGQYPVKGQRWKCETCPHEMGFDLCGPCYQESLTSEVHGRFNQHHTPDHTMVEMPGMPAINNPDQLEILQRLMLLISDQRAGIE